MSNACLKHSSIKGITTIVPENIININDEINYFDNNPKKLERAKKMIGFGKRHVVMGDTTAIDLCEAAANKLITDMNIDRNDIDTLVLVCQSPDYLLPSSSCILHGRLSLNPSCATFDISLGCSGYVYGLWMVHSLIASGSAKNVLLVVGDAPSTHSNVANRKCNPLFGDAASATYITYCSEDNSAYFSLGTDGKGWDRIIVPAGGRKLPIKEDIVNISEVDTTGNVWFIGDEILHGMDVFNFTMDVAPKNIKQVLEFSQKDISEIDYFVIHQANKQIVENVARIANIPSDKTSSETFSKYGNNSTNSVATVICDQLNNNIVNHILISAFGVGLSWGAAVINIKDIYNGGVSVMKNPVKSLTRMEQALYWAKQFKEG